MFLSSVCAFVLVTITPLVAASTENFNPTGARCVDPSGYLSCYQAQNDQETRCRSICDSSKPSNGRADCIAICEGLHLAGNLGCWVQSCWNMVNSCAYQKTAVSYIDGLGLVVNSNTPGARPRYFPTPNSATEGACACNLGYIYDNETTVDPGAQYCSSTTSVTDKANCLCCRFSLGISNILDTCPEYDLTDLNIAGYIKQRASELSGTSSCTILDTNPSVCTSKYGLPYIGKVYNPQNLPAGVPGTKALTDAVGNASPSLKATETFTMFPGYTSIITVSSLNGAGPTGSGATAGPASTAKGNTASSAGGSPTGSQGTATGAGIAAATTATKSNDVGKIAAGWNSGKILMAVALLMCCL